MVIVTCVCYIYAYDEYYVCTYMYNDEVFGTRTLMHIYDVATYTYIYRHV